ncbi:alkanesulfonate monooxygenase SsuD/methylene tetrahydromethanopterin reductase-like flavin-dependent oxidoreductase (luciferase family) [Salana multivorans]|uniref:Alkanesulfonate monooxygenase SsuD/methylene tetrahydromethanopterin reductase-like flavin-dependent oxidoreductase (Luciferase family) n=1 Tax=Salana multivorans TaxID=120377 RepID=A0A3N2DA30_9MICO|nr:LLM class flavin-dependent oxidoreductase [Salana multivorans]ROR96542.1 alkanesulfonate monooxygenase SsuD/methylene tetrahydromethanopterin reductase-like flavin-dependent oxidoreductase (luciferase family) [Salana multivorans]
MTLTSLSFLTPGNFHDDDPGAGLEDTLRLVEAGERLGYQGAWVRQRHLEHGISSAATVLAAATQRTRRIALGTAVVPLGYESPFRLAEDLATVDVLSGGRLQVGVSVGRPPHAELIGELVHGPGWASQDFGYARAEALATNLASGYLGAAGTVISSPGNVQRPRLQPVAAGLRERLWYGGSSGRSLRWAAEHAFHLLTGNIGRAEESDDFVLQQTLRIEEYRRLWSGAGEPQVAVGRVILPTDSASEATRRRYREYKAERDARTHGPQGPDRTLFAPDLLGTSQQIAEQLAADTAVGSVSHLRLELPYELTYEDYEQILTDVADHLAPALGWRGDAEHVAA